jgi:hypothetical protein
MLLVRPSRIFAAVIGLLLTLAVVPAWAEEATADEPTSTQLVLLHERWLAWEPLRPSVRPTDLEGPVDWLKLQLSGVRSQATDWMEDGGFSLLRDRDSQGAKRFTMAAGALTTKWASFHLRARVGRPEMSAGLRPRRYAPAFGVTVPWERFTFELEALDDKDFGYSMLSGLHWRPGDGRVQYGIAMPVSVGHGPSVAAILQVLIHLDDYGDR